MTATIAEKLKLSTDPTAQTSAPAEAFCLESGKFEFESVKDASDSSVPIEMLARSGGVLEHWYWDRIVHDFDGMTHRESIPIDYRHNRDELIGYINRFEVRDGNLFLGGSLESVEQGDTAARVIARGQRGIPYQASIMFDEQLLEWLPEDMSTEVNGQQVEGPAVIVREWELRGCAVTPYGYDSASQSKFSAADNAPRSLRWKGSSPMTKTAETNAPAANALETATPGTATPAPATGAASAQSPNELSAPGAKPEPVTLDPARKELARFLEKFGPEGAGYFSEGLCFEDALEKAFEKRGDRVSELEKELAAERQKLAAAQLEHGEREPIATGSAATQKAPGFESLFKQK